MPSHSVKQARVMSAIAHGWKPKGSAAGIPVSVAKEFHQADAGHKYGAERAAGGPVTSELRDRSTFLFFTPNPDIPDHAQCSSCKNFNDVKGLCFWLSEKDKVAGGGSCGMYGQGKPSGDVVPCGQYTKKDVGYVFHKVRCENCNAYDNRDKSNLHCDLYVQLNRILPHIFKLDVKVTPRSCCNAQVEGKRNPKNFGPYGPIPDADDPNVGGLIMQAGLNKGKVEGRAFGGVAPMMAQAFNPVAPMPPMTGAQGVAPPPPQSMPGPPLSGSSPFSRPMKRGGAANLDMIHHAGVTTGPLISDVPGRTDKHDTYVPSGSYVIPADIVSGHGEGNSLAGMKSLHNLFKMEHAGHPIEGNSSRIASKFAKGGTADKHVGQPVPVHLAGGEIVVPPDKVHETMQRIGKKQLTLEQAHRAMDQWVVDNRKKLRKTLAKLPGPVKD